LKHGLVGKATKLRAKTLWGSMADIHLMERLDEGIWERRLCEAWEGWPPWEMWTSTSAII